MSILRFAGQLLVLVLGLSACTKNRDQSALINGLQGDIINENANYSMVSKALARQDAEASIKFYPQIASEFKLQQTALHNESGKPIFYVFAHYLNQDQQPANVGFEIYRIDVKSKKFEHINGNQNMTNLGDVKTILYLANRPYLLTSHPTHLIALDSNNGLIIPIPLWKDGVVGKKPLELSFKAYGQSGHAICGILEHPNFLAFYYDINSKKLKFTAAPLVFPGGHIRTDRVGCLNDSIYFTSNDRGGTHLNQFKFVDEKFMLLRSEKNKKINLVLRDEETFLTVGDKVYKLAHKLEELNHLPYHNQENFQFIKTYLTTHQINYLDPKFFVKVIDPTNRIIEDGEWIFPITSAPPYSPKLAGLRNLDDEILLGFTEGRSQILKYDRTTETFLNVGSAGGHNVTDIRYYKGRIFLATSNRHLFEFNPAKPWTNGSLEYIQLPVDHIDLNPWVGQTFDDLDVDSLSSITPRENGLLINLKLKNKLGTRLQIWRPDISRTIASFQTPNSFEIESLELFQDQLVAGTRAIGNIQSQSQKSGPLIYLNQDTLAFKSDASLLKDAQEILQLENFENKYLSFISNDKLYIYNKEENSSNLLLKFQGLYLKETIKTHNKKLLTINDSKVLIINPFNKDTRALFDFSGRSIAGIKSMTLFEDELFIIDNLGRLHKVRLKYSDLFLADEV